ncbi:MAG: hypothetical protein WCH35_14985 [Comamonadaceae bacterium]
MKRRRQLLVLLLGAATVLGASMAGAQAAGASVPVQGQVLSRSSGGPVPGVRAVLVHQQLGRSALSYTDAYGHFGWSAIPIRPEPYFLEIYWGQQLIYRQPVTVKSPTTLPPIRM